MARRFLALLSVLVAAGFPLLGQDTRDEIIQKLLARVEALEREVAELKQARGTAPVSQPPAESAITPASAIPAGEAATAPVEAAAVDSAGRVSEDPEQRRFGFRGYADVGFLRNQDNDSAKRFALGEVDLFTTARISRKLSVLAEMVFETDNQLQIASMPVNLERLLLQYRGNDYFNLDIGSYRTAIGFYSTAYLHASWLQTSITRPKLFDFEDDGGFLPLHNVGISANGRIPSGSLDLHYIVEVGSSRNYAQPGQTGFQFEQNGAFNAALYARPEGISGLQVGFSTYHDRFAPLPGVSMNRAIWAAYAVYRAKRFEFLNEGVLARFEKSSLGRANVPGFYSQLGYRTPFRLTPYFRFDYANASGAGTIGTYAPQYVAWRTAATGGVRYDLNDSVALKFEIGRQTARLEPAWIQAAVQLAFTF